MKPSKQLEGSSILWDNSYIAEPAPSRCITGTDKEFEVVANYLMSSVALRWPDDTKLADHPEIENFNRFLRNAAHRIASQMLSTIEYCNEIIGGGMKLRQKPGNPCVMQQEQFEGVWTDVFDYNLCLGEALGELVTEQGETDQIKGAFDVASNLWNDFDSKYTGTSASYDPDLTIDSSNELTNRAALCAALKESLDNYAEQSIKANQQFTDDLSRGAVIIGAGMALLAIIAAIIAFPVVAPLLAAKLAAYFTLGALTYGQASLGLSTALLGLWVQKVKDVDLAILQDISAREAILCVWYNNLKGESDISMEKYHETLDMSGDSPNAQSLYDTIKPLISQPLSYAAFLSEWKKQISIAGAGINLDLCACEDYPLEVVVSSSTWPDTVLAFKGVNGDNQVIWEATLNATGLNASDAIVVRTTNVLGNRYAYLKSVEVLSGSVYGGTYGGQNATPDSHNPATAYYQWTAYALTFPLKLRFKFEDAGY